MRRVSFLVLVALIARSGFASQIDVAQYDIELSIAELGRMPIAARVRIDFEALERIDKVELDIEPEKIAIDSIRDGEGQTLISFIAPGTPNANGLTNSTLVVNLMSPIERGATGTIDIAYRITVQPEGEQRGLFFDPDHHRTALLSTRNWPYYARYWLPSNDHPSDPATFRFTVNVPAGLTAVANGALVGSSATQFVWVSARPVPTYLSQVTVGDLVADIESAGTVPVHFYSPPNLTGRAEYEREIDRAAAAMAYYSSAFGPYAFEKAGFITAPHPFSMESASLIVLTQPGSAVHEMVHHWWGNAVQIEAWGDFWLSEGLTTYFTGFFDEVTRGVNTACMMSGTLNVAPDQDPMTLYTILPYCVGAAAIDDHRRWFSAALGRDLRDPEARALFVAVFRRVYEDRAFDPTNTREFVEALKQASYYELVGAGTEITRFEVDAALEEWLNRWFTGVPPRPLLRRRAAGR